MTLAVHLEELLKAARVDLPDLATYYRDQNKTAGGCADGSADAFTTGDGNRSPVHRYWAALCQELEGVLGRTSNGLDDAGRALGYIVNAYRIEDAEAARELAVLLSDETDPRLTKDPYTHHGPDQPPTTPDPTVPTNRPPTRFS
ncbi:hypothetical protein [Rhizomonospora bruguierae]|uniref:hypothetical protein n=1 Tax=Rhizomonospora bruguierae TaxID=1581705 RepID=UPI001BCAC12C|nr:hypothetical protein [Micromonospora sp. NBRC 107566]